MSRYIDADDFFQTFEELDIEPYNNFQTADVVDRNECSKCVLHPFKQLREQLETNMVEVVRCEDCIHWQKDGSVDLYGSHYCPNTDTRTMEDDYCSYGERREDDER